MSIGRRVADAVDKVAAGDPEGALHAICAAIESTAKQEFGKPGRSSYKEFIHSNLGMITAVAFGGTQVLNIYLAIDHPDLPKGADGLCSIQDIFYHVVRCGLYHDSGLPSALEFADEQRIRCENGHLVLPTSLIYGLIAAVVVAPVNRGESTGKTTILNLGDFPIPVSHLWGRRSEFLWLLDASREVLRLSREEAQARP
jgi:hypothetical protein